MAENIPIKSHKQPVIDKSKVPNVATCTTTENIKLSDSETNSLSVSGLPPSVISNNRKKPCSFQITSVIVGRNNDGGEDSADDLDDISHADDISDVVDVSRITDNETPSLSEDTISKEDIYYNVSGSMSLCSAPVIPTSSQYGLVIVSPGNNADGTNTTTSICSTTSAPISSIPFSVQAGRPPEHIIIHSEQCPNKAATTEHDHVGKEGATPVRADRFKVVKIESTEPFKRGRWTCMDFLDSANAPFSATVTQTNQSSAPNTHPQVAQSLPQMPQVSTQLTQTQVPYYPNQQQQQQQQQQQPTAMSQPFPMHQTAPSSVPQQYVTQMQGSMISPASSYNMQQAAAVQQGLMQQPQGSITQVPPSISSSMPPNMVYNSNARYTSNYVAQPVGCKVTGAQNQFVNPANYVGTSQSYAVPSQPTFIPVQGQTYAGQLQQAIAANIVPMQPGQTYAGHASLPPSTYQLSKTSYAQYQPVSTVSTANAAAPFQYVNQPVYGQPAIYSTGQPVNIVSSPVSVPQGAPAYPTTQTAADIQQTYVPTSEQYQTGIATFTMTQPPPQPQPQTQQQPQPQTNFIQQPEEQSVPVETRDIPTGPEEGQPNTQLPDEADTAAGNSAVAIDNKIEQAMDLVKSHLMFAVREEVEVLKERISELMDRINQLETENSILRANATLETLAQLAPPMSTQASTTPAQSQTQSQSQSPAGVANVLPTTTILPTHTHPSQQ